MWMPSMRNLLYRVLHFLHFKNGQGSWRLARVEIQLVQALLAELPGEVGNMLRRQIEQSFFVERMTGGRINVLRYYGSIDSHRISDPAYLDKLFRVRIAVDGRQENAHITFYGGILFSIEFKKSRRFYKDKTIDVLSISTGSPDDSYTHFIDREEHGPDV
jgi:hypothetical protein